jgi:hypothetical protein
VQKDTGWDFFGIKKLFLLKKVEKINNSKDKS